MAFSQKLEAWYNDFGRDLPWRGIDNPYHIWLSEIILQQTRIEQGRDYWFRFIEAFPMVADLAAATEEQVLRLWQGLGYYSRARNLHAAAQYIMDQCGGRFPDTYDGILHLKGVGRYTAAAIASFAYRLPYPVIDGNVYRFISRLYGIATPVATDAAYTEFEGLLRRLIDPERPDRFNAALMDFGSLQCRPAPDCAACPFASECVALRTGRVDSLPVKAAKVRPTDRWFLYLDLRYGDRRLMQQRTARDIWRNLWELPLVELDGQAEPAALVAAARRYCRESLGLTGLRFSDAGTCVHQLTHRTVHAAFLWAEIATPPAAMPENMRMVSAEEIKDIPVSRLIDRYLQGL